MRNRLQNFAGLLLLTTLGILIQGYHPGLEDDAYYLAAIKYDLNPHLFPHDADFFRVLFQATIFDKMIALVVRLTHLPLDWTCFLFQIGATFLILWGCLRIARRCFTETYAQWAAVTLIAALLTLPLSGSGLSLTDQHLHPRALATALIIAAIVAVLDRRYRLAALLLVFAFPLHLNMTPFGVSFCFFLWWRQRQNAPGSELARSAPAAFALLIPFSWMFEPASPTWREAEATRHFYFLLQWTWYEWLGVFGPILILWWFRYIARSRGSKTVALLAESAALFAAFQLVVALILMLPPPLERFRSFEPMRFLHLTYLFLVLLGGGLLGRFILKQHVWRWLILFVPLGAGMFYAQRALYPATVHLELPGRNTHNPWIDAFRWISHNTPVDAYFALDPEYMGMSGEDYHGFRALAERSVLADALKDPCIVVRIPSLGPRWVRERDAQIGWRNFRREDFLRLKSEFGVDWVVLNEPQASGLTCPYSNGSLAVCRVQ